MHESSMLLEYKFVTIIDKIKNDCFEKISEYDLSNTIKLLDTF